MIDCEEEKEGRRQHVQAAAGFGSGLPACCSQEEAAKDEWGLQVKARSKETRRQKRNAGEEEEWAAVPRSQDLVFFFSFYA